MMVTYYMMVSQRKFLQRLCPWHLKLLSVVSVIANLTFTIEHHGKVKVC